MRSWLYRRLPGTGLQTSERTERITLTLIHAPYSPAVERTAKTPRESKPMHPIGATLLTGGFDRPYVFGLATALTSRDINLDVIGSDVVDHPGLHRATNLTFHNLQRKGGPKAGAASKALRTVAFYARLLRYAFLAKPKIFHILWNNKLIYFDRTLLLLVYKVLGKKVVFTAHNVNAGKRDGNDSWFNRLTLRIQYRICDHIFVHTEAMKGELVRDFGVEQGAITVIPFGINDSVSDTYITPEQAKHRLGITLDEKVILFFGAIRPYKGLEYLVAAFQSLSRKDAGYRLIIAGEPKRGTDKYVDDIQNMLKGIQGHRIIQKIEHVPDEEIEIYFKAADVCVLPYTLVFQSGVLFLSYAFGLPAIASDVGSFRDDIIEGETGNVCKPCDAEDLARTIETYFASDLYKTLDRKRKDIREYAASRYSWDVVGEKTRSIYTELLEQ
jgi:D-inositol-3-phosphate glycosyltransferase